MTAEEFEELDERQVESWLFRRFRRLCAAGHEPAEALKLASNARIDIDTQSPAKDQEGRDQAAGG
jgi:hypothetical protein